jgi:hypothetical protein
MNLGSLLLEASMLFSSWKDKAFDPSEYDHYMWLLDEDGGGRKKNALSSSDPGAI